MENNHDKTRTLVLRTRVSEAEYADIVRRAASLHTTISALLRNSSLGVEIKPTRNWTPPAELSAIAVVIGHLGRVGNNVNQIAKALNGASTSDARRFEDVLVELRVVLGKVRGLTQQ